MPLLATLPLSNQTRKGRKSRLKLGIMTVWVKDGGTWKLLGHQSFRT